MKLDKRKLKVLMATRDFDSQRELAEKANISRCTLNNALNGKSCADETVQKIANALNVSIDEILED